MDTEAQRWVSANFQGLSFLVWYLAQALVSLKVSITWSRLNLHVKGMTLQNSIQCMVTARLCDKWKLDISYEENFKYACIMIPLYKQCKLFLATSSTICRSMFLECCSMTLHDELLCSILVPVSPPQMSILTTPCVCVASPNAYLSTLPGPQAALSSLWLIVSFLQDTVKKKKKKDLVSHFYYYSTGA